MRDDESESHRATDFKGSCVPPFIGNDAQQPLFPMWVLQKKKKWGGKELVETEADDKGATIQTAGGEGGREGGRKGGGFLNNQT